MRCLDGVKILVESGRMTELTDMELTAIRDARQQFAEALNRHGLMAPFFDQPAEVIDALIGAAVNGFRASLQRQSATGSVPF